MTVEGRERYPISVRFILGLSGLDLDSLKCVRCRAVFRCPISLLADISNRIGPAVSKFAE